MEEKRAFTLTVEPVGEVYRALLDASLRNCASALLVERPSLGLGDRGKLLLEQLATWIKEEKETSEWPGTRLYGHTALVRKFTLNQESTAILKYAAASLYQWQQPELLEDLCLLSSRDEPWLISIAHEADGYLRLTETERVHLVAIVPALATMLRYDGVERGGGE